jgi:hypothetical protein
MMLRDGHSEGMTREDIENALKILPVVSESFLYFIARLILVPSILL